MNDKKPEPKKMCADCFKWFPISKMKSYTEDFHDPVNDPFGNPNIVTFWVCKNCE
jgi:hypothetical protein